MSEVLVEEAVRKLLPPEDLPTRISATPQLARPQTDAELAEWFERTLGLRFPNVSVCPGHSHPWAAICDAYFARGPVTVWKASRGFGGKTYSMGALAFAEALTLQANVNVLGGSGEQAVRVLEYLKDFWAMPHAPRNVLVGDPAKQRTQLVWGNRLTALMASMASVSGPHPQRLRVDEVDVCDIGLLDQALGQPMSKDGVRAHVLLSSAHYEADGTFTEVLKRAAEKGWRVHQWCWRECVRPHGWLDPSEIQRQRDTVTAAMWRIQYDLQEPSPVGRAIAVDKVERMFVGARIESGEEFPYTEFEPPVEGAHYAHGADWARSRDFVEVVTLRDDVLPMRLVAYQRFRKRAAPYIFAAHARQTGRYPGSSAHDSTSLGGKVIDDMINPEGQDVAHVGVTMVGQVRQRLFTDYILGIEHEEVVSPRIGVLFDQHRFATVEDLRPGGSGHPPDGFVAGAMAYQASQQSQGARLRLLTGAHRPAPAAETPMGRALGFLGGGNGHGNGSNGGGA